MLYCVLTTKMDIVGMFHSLERAMEYANKFKDTNRIVLLTNQEINLYLKGEIIFKKG